MNHVELDMRLRIDAAKALMAYMHPKIGEAGKKEEKQNAAKKAGGGKFGPAKLPKLKLIRPDGD